MKVIATTDERAEVLVTVGLEDYFHVGAFASVIEPGQWTRFERRVASSTVLTLDFLDRLEIRATFFVMGWVADHLPEVVRAVVDRGHEVATQGYGHHRIGQLSPSAFREDLQRAKEAVERASRRPVLGHRVPQFLGPKDLWALDVIADEGYRYDSSIRPLLGRFTDDPGLRYIHPRQTRGGALIEVPVASVQWGGLAWPIAGGGAFRQLPERLVDRAVEGWFAHEQAPFVLYFHTWELDPDQPRIQGSRLQRIRQYRNLDRMPETLARHLRGRRCSSIADYLGLRQPPIAAEPRTRRVARPSSKIIPLAAARDRQPITIVVPVYNESEALRFLANTLESVSAVLGPSYDVSYCFVDDGSSDDTPAQLERLFGHRADCQIVRHPRNLGVGAAMMTGIRAAQTEIVCSIDADCTYDPLELQHMIPKLTEGVALVTGSPYHPAGRVISVPGWRLALSRGASALYRLALRQRLYTFTSCFRVYRRSAVVDIELREGGFLGVAELLAQLVLSGAIVVEHPAVLRVRVLGHSKMKTARAVVGHLRLLGRLRLQGPRIASTKPARRPKTNRNRAQS